MKEYNFKKIEKKWQGEWDKKKLYKAKDGDKKPKYYCLIEFPYPSGDGLHVGHTKSNTAMDIIARKRRMQGYNVLYPIGWDAFGLPTENYAIKKGVHPSVVTKKNTDNFRRQLKSIGFSFDWEREINTTDPKYYKWTQWIFLQLYKKGLAYKRKMPINWCLSCKVGLANEEVLEGKCERCGSGTEKREKEQWMLAITKYADRLDKDLDTVDYLEKIKIQQRNWIGKSEGTLVDFLVVAEPGSSPSSTPVTEGKGSRRRLPDSALQVFTTRVDTIFGCTYVVVAPEHKLVAELKNKITNYKEVEKYISDAARKSDLQRTELQKEKTGVELKGIRAINPFNNEEVPVFAADYVLGHYGTGAVMAVPAHDERDFEFAKKYNLPIVQSIAPYKLDESNPPRDGVKNTVRSVVHVLLENDNGEVLTLNLKGEEWGSEKPKNLIIGGIEEGETPEAAALREIKEETGYVSVDIIKVYPIEFHAEFFAAHKNLNRYVKTTGVFCKLKSQKREPVKDEEKKMHDIVWVKREMLPSSVTIPDDIFLARSYIENRDIYTEDGCLVDSGEFTGLKSLEARAKMAKWLEKNKLGKKQVQFKLRDWVFSRQHYWGEPIPMVNCPKCGMVPVPEKSLPVELPNVKKYEPTDTGESPLAAITKWVNTKCPKCKGPAKRETDTMPNWAGSSWYFLRYIDPKNNKALADKRKLKYWTPVDWYNGGMEHTTLHLLYSRFWNKFLYDIKAVPFSEPYKKRTSHGLILGPDGEKMSKSRGNVINPDDMVAAYGADAYRLYQMFMGPFDQAIPWDSKGIEGTSRFLYRVWKMQAKLGGGSTSSFEILLHKTIKKVSEDIEEMRFNTAISALMILSNEMEKESQLPASSYQLFITLLAPFAPHFAEEVWANLGNRQSVHLAAWPKFNPNKLIEDEVNLVVQINGKFRAAIKMPVGASQQEAEKLAMRDDNVSKWLSGATIKKIIFVPNKLINIVI